MAKAGRKKRSVSPQSRDFIKARALITKRGNIRLGISIYKNRASSDEICRVMPELLRHRAYHALIWPDIKPKTYDALGKQGIWGRAPLESELAWQVQALLPYHREISKFLEFRSQFATAFLVGRYHECDALLEEIEEAFGKNLWSIEASINLIQARDGFSPQKEFTNTVLSHKGLNPMWRYLITWFTFRAERNVSAIELARHVERTVPLTSAYAHLVHLAIGLCPKINEDTAGAALGYLSHMPLVDRYVFLVMICQALLASNHSDSVKTQLANQLVPLVQCVTDHGLIKLKLACSVDTQIARPQSKFSAIAALDAYSAHDYPGAVAAAWDGVNDKPSIDALQIGLRADAAGDLGSSLPKFAANSSMAAIAEDLRRVISYADNASEAVRRLDKAALTWPQAAWASSLRLILDRQRRDDRVAPSSRQQIFHALRTEDENPLLAATLSQLGVAERYLETFYPQSHSAAVSTMRSIITDCVSADVPVTNIARVDMLRALRAGRYLEATGLLEGVLAASPTQHARLELGRQLFNALLQTGELQRAADVAAELILISHFAATLLPIKKLVDALVKADLAGNSEALGRLSVSIVFDFYSRNISSDRDAERADAFNDFLSYHKLTYASDLDVSSSGYPADQIVYFMRNVCVPEVLDQSLNLASSRAVEDERAKVIVKASDLLNQTGQATPNELLEEVREIKLKQVVRDTTLKLDQSKVYVNVEGIRKEMAGQIREGWHRFRLFKMHENSVSSLDDLSKKIQELVGERYQIIISSAPATEKYRMFSRMVLDVMDQFTGSREFGLDANLSTNIRHGFIIRALRGPFVARNLITNKATDSGEYQDNIYWLERAELSDSQEVLLNEALARFSAEIDDEIEAITRRFLRIRGEAAPDGLFDFQTNDISMQLLMQRWEDEDDYEVFVDKMFDYLWALTEKSLQLVRSHLVHHTLATMQTSLTQLGSTVEGILPPESVSALGAAINLVRPDLQSAVEKVASWFTLSLTQDYQNYAPQIAFDTALATVRSYYSHLNIETEFESEENLLLAGRTLPHMTRLFTILFENAAFHSGISQGDLLIKGSVISDTATLELSLSNSLSSEKDMAQLATTVAKLNAEFGRDAQQEFIRVEGGSGYPKIWKILRHDLHQDHALEVNITENSEFSVVIAMDSKGMLA